MKQVDNITVYFIHWTYNDILIYS